MQLQNILFGNYILTVAAISWIGAQIAKTIINYLLVGKFDPERLYGAGGMPSAHSAFVCSAFMATARSEGVSSPLFAIAFILAAVVMYDAMGVRHETGKQAKVLNKLLDDWLDDEEDNDEDGSLAKLKKLKEKVGHTPLEVLSGALFGILIAILIPVPAAL